MRFSEQTGEGVYLLHLFLPFGEWVCILKIAYPFVKHIPIAIVMSISRFRSCAGMCRGWKQQDITFLFRSARLSTPARSEKQFSMTSGQHPEGR